MPGDAELGATRGSSSRSGTWCPLRTTSAPLSPGAAPLAGHGSREGCSVPRAGPRRRAVPAASAAPLGGAAAPPRGTARRGCGQPAARGGRSPKRSAVQVLHAGGQRASAGLPRALPEPLQAARPRLAQPPVAGEMLQSPHHLSSPLLGSLQYAHLALVLGSPELDTALQLWPHQC